MMKISFQTGGASVQDAGYVVTARCPHCSHNSIFEIPPGARDMQCSQPVLNGVPVATGRSWLLGQRICPNPACRGHVFFVADPNQGVLFMSPPEVIDFDQEGVPHNVVAALSEALICHANGCYKAAAMMVRKTLEEICQERGASGGSLEDRIEALQTKVVLPPEFLDVMTEIRYLGNDAAHVVAREYDEIGREEVELGIDLTKLLLQSLYRTATLLDKLRSRKKGDDSATT